MSISRMDNAEWRRKTMAKMKAEQTEHSALVNLIEEQWMQAHAEGLTDRKLTGQGGDIPKKKTRTDKIEDGAREWTLMRLLVAATGEFDRDIEARLRTRMQEQGMRTTYQEFTGS